MLKPFSVMLVFLLFSSMSFSQETIAIRNACSLIDGQTINVQKAEKDVVDLVTDIIKLSGLSLQVRFYASEKTGKLVASFDEQGPLMIHPASLVVDADSKKNWAAVVDICRELFTICTEETLGGHWTCTEKAIEADRFAGHILHLLEAPIGAGNSALNNKNNAAFFKDQPSIDDRKAALTTGWEETKAALQTVNTFAAMQTAEMPVAPEVSNPKAIRFNQHLTLKRSAYPILKESWNSGFQIRESVYLNGQWYVVMTPKGSDFLSQAMRLRKTFPEKDIKELWDDKHDITRVEYYNDVWFLCMTKTTGSFLQRWRTRHEFPEKEITKNWNDGFYIVDMTYGDSLYALILDKKTADYKTQTWYRRTLFPEKEIVEHWAKDEQITVLKYLNGEWVLVMTKFTDPKKQKWFSSNTFPSNILEIEEDNGFIIKGLNYGPDQWTLVMEEK